MAEGETTKLADSKPRIICPDEWMKNQLGTPENPLDVHEMVSLASQHGCLDVITALGSLGVLPDDEREQNQLLAANRRATTLSEIASAPNAEKLQARLREQLLREAMVYQQFAFFMCSRNGVSIDP